MTVPKLQPRLENRTSNRWIERELRNLDTIKNTWDEQFNQLKSSYDKLIKISDEKDYVLRSQIAFLFSLFDFVLHEIIKFGLVNMYSEKWEQTDHFNKIHLTMEDFKNGHRSQFSEQWFIAIQDRNYKASTLCNYKNLCEQFKLLGLDKKEIADEAFYVQGSEEKTDEKLRHTINTLNDLRNPIVHEASIDILSLEAISLEEHEVIDLMENINKIVEAIIKVMERKIS